MIYTFYKKNINKAFCLKNKNIKNGVFLLTLFLLLINVGFGQNNTIFSGIVIDNIDKTPIPFCNVYIENTSIGTITNENGAFRLTVPKYINKNLCISFIGYKTKKIPLKKLKHEDNIITLSKDEIELAEIVIMPDSTLLTFLQKAYRAIDKNYPKVPSKLKGFYRETQYNENNEYLYFSEAILSIFKNSYQFSNDPGQVEVIVSRKKSFPIYKKTNNVKYYGGAFIPLNLDFVQKRIDFITPKHFDKYAYRLSNITKLDGRTLYEISFDTNNDSLKGSCKGKFYIDKESLAYIMAEYELTERGIKKYNNLNINAHEGIKKCYYIQYFYFKNKWQLKYCRHNENAINKTYKSKLKRANEFLTTDIITDLVKPIPYEKQLGYFDVFLDKAMLYDSTNWKDYNIVKTNNDLLYSIEQAKGVFSQEIDASEEIRLLKFIKNFNFDFTLHTQFNQTSPSHYNIIFQPNNNQIFQNTGDLNNKQHWDFGMRMGYMLNKKWEVYYYNAVNLTDNYLNLNNFGFSYIACLKNKGRQIFMDLGINYYFLNSGYLLGNFDNNSGSFKAGDTKIDADKLALYCGIKENGIAPEITFRTKLKGYYHLIFTGGYYFPVTTKDRVFIEEKSGFILTRRIGDIPLNNNDIELIENNNNISSTMFSPGNFYLQIGIEFKL